MAAYETGDLGTVPKYAGPEKITQFLEALLVILDARLVDFETRIALNDAK